jgi:hypothetical protein
MDQDLKARSHMLFGQKSCRVVEGTLILDCLQDIRKKSCETHDKWEQAFRNLEI